MTPQISVQLYTVREQAQASFSETLRQIADLGYRHVEPAGFPGTTANEAAALFKDLGLQAPSCHAPLPVGDDRQRVIEETLAIGSRYLIISCPPNWTDDFATLDQLKATAELYCEAAENAAAHGIQLGYHNHDWDLLDLDGTAAYRLFLEHGPKDLLWEADIFWIAKTGLDPVSFIEEMGPRGKVLHFKDGLFDFASGPVEVSTDAGPVVVTEETPFLPAGAGSLDMPATAAAAKHAEYFVVELDEYNGDVMEALKQSYRYLNEAGIVAG
ncbi:MAG: sugar phosphate isomerase/epimerase [Planctomycetota bacterium]